MRSWWLVIIGLLVGLAVAGLILLAATPPRGEPVELLPPPTISAIVVHVSGAVSVPGVYSLPPGSRVQDAVEAAGGLALGAGGEGVNLAAVLEDGQQIYVSPGPVTPTPTLPVFPTATPNPFININTADQAELESLPGIGVVLARRIIAYRTRYGPFATIADVKKVSGISPTTFALIEPYISAEPPP